jgi:DNA polymerase-3 subunit beta
VSFQQGEVYLVSRLVQGQFPDYKQVIPKKNSTQVTIETQGFLNAAERAAVVASGSANVTRFEIKGGRMVISAHTPDVGSIEEALAVEVKGAEKTQASFNIRLIIDVLRAINAEKVVLEMSEGLSPGVIRPDKGADYIYIVMPIRTQGTA